MPDIWEFRRARPLARNGKTLVMGIVNLTPDSFSGGGKPAPTPAQAADAAFAMLAAGADIVDFGAESSRPGATALRHWEETERLGDVVARVRAESDAPLSIDTYHPESAAYVLEQGADIINDITALRGGWSEADLGDTRMAAVAAKEKAHVVLMHMPAPPTTMQNAPVYADVVEEVTAFLRERAEFAQKNGIAPQRIWLDPGFGFGKTFQHNRELLLRLNEFVGLGFSLLAGLSRKRMIHDALGLPPDHRLEGSLALAVIASMTGASIVRVHDVGETLRAVRMADAVRIGLD